MADGARVWVCGDETFTLGLSSPTNATLGSPSSATGTIVDNDPAREYVRVR